MQVFTSLPVDACVARLRGALEERPPGPLISHGYGLRKDVVGHVDAAGFAIQRSGYGADNSLRPEVTGRFLPDRGGTRVVVRVGVSATMRRLLQFAAAFWLLLWAVGLCAVLGDPERNPPREALTWMVGVPLGQAAIVLVGRALVRGDGAALVAFVQRTLDAERMVPEPPPAP